MPNELKRKDVPDPVQRMLWGKSAGRCEFRGCNKPLWKSSVTAEQVNTAQKAHIYAVGGGGPRHSAELTEEELNDLANLMLVCHECHQKIDDKEDGGRYTDALLQEMKAEHEARIERVTGIDPSHKSHVVFYGANIGDHDSPLSRKATEQHLFPARYPAEDRPIELGMHNCSLRDNAAKFWDLQAQQLITMFGRRIRERMAAGAIEHLSVFALAPQPLLMLLGSLMTDLPDVDVFQLKKEPKGWQWEDDSPLEFIVEAPPEKSGTPALVLALSATVSDERIQKVLGDDVAIWRVAVAAPNNDLLRSREQLQRFRQLARPLLDRIKKHHGQDAMLHVFPAAPVSVCVELGRVRMPKTDLPWQVYDQVNELGGFVPAIRIPPGEKQ
ncbi:MAG: SAVED domain-containing protein [Phycisphaerae bacterium]|nr:SAVED domain-containing protein [Phycisphaerae bacterium]